MGEGSIKSSRLKPGEILLLENLRFHAEETAGDETFAKSLLVLQTFISTMPLGHSPLYASTTICGTLIKESSRLSA